MQGGGLLTTVLVSLLKAPGYLYPANPLQVCGKVSPLLLGSVDSWAGLT